MRCQVAIAFLKAIIVYMVQTCKLDIKTNTEYLYCLYPFDVFDLNCKNLCIDFGTVQHYWRGSFKIGLKSSET